VRKSNFSVILHAIDACDVVASRVVAKK